MMLGQPRLLLVNQLKPRWAAQARIFQLCATKLVGPAATILRLVTSGWLVKTCRVWVVTGILVSRGNLVGDNCSWRRLAAVILRLACRQAIAASRIFGIVAKIIGPAGASSPGVLWMMRVGVETLRTRL